MKIPRLGSALIFGILAAGWLLVGLGHAYVVPRLQLPLLIGLADPAVHGLVSLLLVLPLASDGCGCCAPSTPSATVSGRCPPPRSVR